MAPTPEQREARLRLQIARYEQLAEKHPRRFAWQLTAMAILGQAAAGLICLAAAAVVVFLGMQFLEAHWAGAKSAGSYFGGTLAAGFMALYLASGAWVRIPPPQGLPIGRYDAPRLSELIEQLRRGAGGPAVHDILLTPEATAMVYSRPWLGLAGPRRNTLILGIPLLAGLSDGQMHAILAHEFAHIGEYRWPLSLWIHRSLTICRQENLGLLGLLLSPFSAWYRPRLEAMAIVAQRLSERRADSVAARLAGVGATGEALVQTFILHDFVQRRYWPEVLRGAGESMSPPGRLISSLAEQITAGEPRAKAPAALRRALRDLTGYDDSHPALAERLAGIGWPPGGDPAAAPVEELIPPPPDQTAMQTFFDPQFSDEALAILDHAWATGLAAEWFSLHADADHARRELKLHCEQCSLPLDTLPRDPRGVPLPPEELPSDPSLRARLAKLLAAVYGEQAAAPWYERVLELDPAHAEAGFALGRARLEQEDPAGAPLVAQALENSPLLVIDGCELLYHHYRGTGDLETADRYRRRAHEHALRLQQVEAEALSPPAARDLLPHDLPAHQVQRLCDQLRRIEGVERAYFCRRALRSMPEFPAFLLILESPRSWLQSQSRDQKLAQQVTERVRFDRPFVVFPLSLTPQLRRPLHDSEHLIFCR